ncbi:hypothetical protein DE94_19490, partial [Salmonella enterica subsp. enterica serovar Saintpaul]|uniref:hypothetical protein n=1 Tax=Salmonella enterica TaxID=28901 RepID=UPI00073CF2F6
LGDSSVPGLTNLSSATTAEPMNVVVLRIQFRIHAPAKRLRCLELIWIQFITRSGDVEIIIISNIPLPLTTGGISVILPGG